MTDPPSPNPERRSERAQQAILRAALDLCREEGYANVGVDAIAARAGVGKQTIYRWWPSKRAVVTDAVLAEALPRLHFVDSGNFVADLRRQLTSMAAVMSDPELGPRIAELVGEAQLDRELHNYFFARVVGPLRALNRQQIAEAAKRGKVRRAVDPEVAADMLFGPLWFRLLMTKAPIGDDYVDSLIETALGGIGATERPRRSAPKRRST